MHSSVLQIMKCHSEMLIDYDKGVVNLVFHAKKILYYYIFDNFYIIVIEMRNQYHNNFTYQTLYKLKNHHIDIWHLWL